MRKKIAFYGTVFFLLSLLVSCKSVLPEEKLTPAPPPLKPMASMNLPNHIKKQEEYKYITELAHQGAIIQRENNHLHIIMPDTSLFKTNSFTLNDALMKTLDDVAALMRVHLYKIAVIDGHTDERGSLKVNQALSERRSHAVIAYLEAQGIPGNRLYAMGHGETMPRASNKSASGQAMNRRVEITIREPKHGEQSY